MSSMKILLRILLVFIIISPSVFAADSDFYERKAEGWFWHNEYYPPEEVEPKPIKPEPPKVEPQEEPEEVVEQSTPEPGPEFGSSAWIRENLQKYMDKAIDNPTPENTENYLYIQRLMMDKSEKFTYALRTAIMSNPELDENTRTPISTFGVKAANEESNKNTKEILNRLSKDVGIWFFFQSTCGYCEKQVVVQQQLERKYGLKTYAISLDGRPLPSGAFPDYVVDQGQSSQLEIYATPAMYLVKPSTKEVTPLGQGVIDQDMIVERIILAAKNAGWLDDATYYKTRADKGTMITLEPPLKVDREESKENSRENEMIEILKQQLKRDSNEKSH